MNILPKKRWHVRTKDNIARVRRDEAEAAEKEKKRLDKLELAESEARINFLRHQSGLPELKKSDEKSLNKNISTDEGQQLQHVDLFPNFRNHIKTTNKDLEKEKKEEQEKYEKQIGYLTYLGQDTNEALKLRSWYEKAPKRSVGKEDGSVEEKDGKNKHSQDPLTLIKSLLPSDKIGVTKSVHRDRKKRVQSPPPNSYGRATSTIENKETTLKENSKKKKKSKKDKRKLHRQETPKFERNKEHKDIENDKKQRKTNMLEKLRRDRLQREASERVRQDALLLTPIQTKSADERKSETPIPIRKVQKYNSQFNPDLAKQNML